MLCIPQRKILVSNWCVCLDCMVSHDDLDSTQCKVYYKADGRLTQEQTKQLGWMASQVYADDQLGVTLFKRDKLDGYWREDPGISHIIEIKSHHNDGGGIVFRRMQHRILNSIGDLYMIIVYEPLEFDAWKIRHIYTIDVGEVDDMIHNSNKKWSHKPDRDEYQMTFTAKSVREECKLRHQITPEEIPQNTTKF